MGQQFIWGKESLITTHFREFSTFYVYKFWNKISKNEYIQSIKYKKEVFCRCWY